MKILYAYFDCEEHPSGRFQRAGARRFARLMGWELVCDLVGRTADQIRRSIARHRPDGLIIEASFRPEGFPIHAFGRLPVVYLDCSVTAREGRIWKVVYDSDEIGRRGARELLRTAHQHSDFAYVGYKRKLCWSDLRAKGFADEILRAGHHVRILSCHRGETPESYRSRMANWIRACPRKTAFMAANDEMAQWLLEALLAAGWNVPQDAVVLGVDNDEEICSQVTPTLTSIRLDTARAGQVAVELLGDRLRGASPSPRTVLIGRSTVISRRSTLGGGCADAAVVAASNFIRERATWGISAHDVIERMGVSPRMAELAYRKATGRSIAADIQLVRFEAVFALLKVCPRTLSALADMCGFNNTETLRREFHRRTGLSIREWCRRNCASVRT